jgi:hypothetical protein
MQVCSNAPRQRGRLEHVVLVISQALVRGATRAKNSRAFTVAQRAAASRRVTAIQ